MKNPPKGGPRLCEQQVVGGGQGASPTEKRGSERRLAPAQSLAWVRWCLSSFERWLKAFPQAAQS